MSRLIKITSQDIEEARKDFERALKKNNYTVQRKATLYFTELAYLKMTRLVQEFNKEVAWHGIAKRGQDRTKDEYIIYDILVYPQRVTGATVTTDQEEYQTWLMNHEDEVFNNIRMQGHSYVNMAPIPSSIDNSLYEKIFEQLEDDMFYIFLIWNKRGDRTIKIYDLEKNILFETSDIDVKVLDDMSGIELFLNEAKKLVCEGTF